MSRTYAHQPEEVRARKEGVPMRTPYKPAREPRKPYQVIVPSKDIATLDKLREQYQQFEGEIREQELQGYPTYNIGDRKVILSVIPDDKIPTYYETPNNERPVLGNWDIFTLFTFTPEEVEAEEPVEEPQVTYQLPEHKQHKAKEHGKPRVEDDINLKEAVRVANNGGELD